MPRVNRTPAQRDRQLERVRRLRRAIVSAGVLGSLGLAGFVAVSTEQQRAAAADTTQPTAPVPAQRNQTRGTGDDSFSRWQSGSDDQGGDDGTQPPAPAQGQSGGQSSGQSGSQSGGQSGSQSGGQSQAQPAPAPSLQPGSGTSHGSSGGS